VKPLTHEEVQELLGAYALHAVSSDEADVVEQHLEECPRCRAEVAGHREVATFLGNTGGDAPEGIWDRISSQLEESPPPMRLNLPGAQGNVIPLAPRRRPRTSRVVAVAIGAAAALAIGVLGAQMVRQQDQLDRFEAAVEDGSMLKAANVALRDPTAATTKLRSFDGKVTADAVLLPNGIGYLIAHDLPGLEASHTYQLWGRTDSGPISLGLLGPAPGAVVPFSANDDISALAITAEEAGGVVQSKNPAVLSGDLS